MSADGSAVAVPTLALPNGDVVPTLGQGTWSLGEGQRPAKDEIAALRRGIELGLTLLDTAEMYGDGATEELVGEAIAGSRDAVYLVSKVLPNNATRAGTIAACERSLQRLRTDRLDLYLLHWRGRVPLAETLAAFETLVRDGKIRAWGVSNLDPDDMAELASLPGGKAVQTDQVLYNLARRAIEHDLLPWCRAHGVPLMAYSPIAQGRILGIPALALVAERHGATPAQVALAWLLRQDGVLVIPRTGTVAHVEENRAALDLQLTEEDLAALDVSFPRPRGPQPLAML